MPDWADLAFRAAEASHASEPMRVTPQELEALHEMVTFWYAVPLDVRKLWQAILEERHYMLDGVEPSFMGLKLVIEDA
jgi:hypothetical protein